MKEKLIEVFQNKGNEKNMTTKCSISSWTSKKLAYKEY